MRPQARWQLAWCVPLIAVVGTAAADPAADRLFREGRRLMRAGDLDVACERFASSQQLDPSVGTLLNLADCRERTGELATAWRTFAAARTLAEQRGDRRATEATARMQRLEPRLSFLTIEVAAPPPGLTVTRDGVPIEVEQWARAAPIAPGSYTVEARAPGYRPSSRTVALLLGQRARVDLALVADQPLTSAAPAPPVVVPPAAAIDRTVDRRVRTQPLRSLAVGVALGANSREVALVGVRAVAGIPMPGGALRGTGTVLFSRYEDSALDPIERTSTISLGLGADYVYAPLPQVGFAAGLGVGFDHDAIRQGAMATSDIGAWWMLHASPVLVRVADGRVEVGLHVQVVRAADEWTTIGLATVDGFLR